MDPPGRSTSRLLIVKTDKALNDQIRTMNYRNPPGNVNRSKLTTELAKRVLWFSKVPLAADSETSSYTSFTFVTQKMDGVAPEPIWEKYCFQQGVVDADHLQLVALERVSQSSWMLHLRLISPSVPQS